MVMSSQQRGVAAGMAAAMATAVLVLGAALAYGGAEAGLDSEALRAKWLAGSVLAPVIMLAICIARLAKHRFFTPADIDGSALTAGTDRARLLQALLQNTLEQGALAVPVYFAGSVFLAGDWFAVVPAAALLFMIGRLFFFIGYAGGAPSRAYGFALTFYPTLLVLVAMVGAAVSGH